MFKKILVIRTDRMGDVALTTPVIKALRDNLPRSHIAIMVTPANYEIVEANPYLDEVIIYDKEGAHKGIFSFLRFARELKKKRFDLAVVLHTKNRTNILSFLAGIPQRVGYYNKKCGFLLTTRLKDTRAKGEKHELEYCLDVLCALGIQPKDKNLFIPLKKKYEDWADNLLKSQGVKETDKLIALNPAASCPSKRWPPERFAQVAKGLIKKFNTKILIIGGKRDVPLVKKIIQEIGYPVIDLSGKTSVGQLASILRRSHLFISNDSGPVHIAVGVGTPVISIFGRNQAGLSPERWRPLGEKDIALHKEVGCQLCLAHNCKKDFLCLKAIKVEEVLDAASAMLNSLTKSDYNQ